MVTAHLLPLDLSPATLAACHGPGWCVSHSSQRWSSPLKQRT